MTSQRRPSPPRFLLWVNTAGGRERPYTLARTSLCSPGESSSFYIGFYITLVIRAIQEYIFLLKKQNAIDATIPFELAPLNYSYQFTVSSLDLICTCICIRREILAFCCCLHKRYPPTHIILQLFFFFSTQQTIVVIDPTFQGMTVPGIVTYSSIDTQFVISFCYDKSPSTATHGQSSCAHGPGLPEGG